MGLQAVRYDLATGHRDACTDLHSNTPGDRIQHHNQNSEQKMFFSYKETTYFQIGFRDYSTLEFVHEMMSQ